MAGPDLAKFLSGNESDRSKVARSALASMITAGRSASVRSAVIANGNVSIRLLPEKNTDTGVSPESFMAQETVRGSKPWDDIVKTLGNGRNDGVMRLAAALRETTSYTLDEALDHMYAHVWPLVDQGQGGHSFPQSEFEEVIAAVWRQYPGMGDKITEAVAWSEQAAAPPPPPGEAVPDELPHDTLQLTDAFLIDRVAGRALSGGYGGPYKWAPGLGWMRWQESKWEPADHADVCEEIRRYFRWLLKEVSDRGADQALLAKLVGLLTKAKIFAFADLARGHPLVRSDAADFDAHPDLLNTPGGVVDLRTGEIRGHDPELMLTKITSGNYVPGFTHPDWEQALTALDAPEREWYQGRVGQGITGHPPEDGIMPVLQGPGSNGKTLMSTDGLLPALGDYASAASHKLVTSQKAGSSEHSTEMADLKGKRLLIGEELSEGRSIDVTALKRIMDVSQIRARFVHKDNISFTASHSLFCTTNYRPVINETDHGTWRRLALLVFRYTFRKPDEALVKDTDRHGDPELKTRIRRGWERQHDAVVTWAVQGAMRWYARGMTALPETDQIRDDTRAWRASADHIMSFWDEFLVKDAGNLSDHPPCISASHLHAVFNAWLMKNGHATWTKQTFASRFGEHGETTSKAVYYQVTSRLQNLSWYRGTDLQVPAETLSQQMRVWVGTRFRLPADNAPTWEVDEVDGSSGNFPNTSHVEEFQNIRQPRQPPAPPAAIPKSDEVVTETQSPWNGQVTRPEPKAPSAAPPIPLVRPSAPLVQPPPPVTLGSGQRIVFDLETASADDLFMRKPEDPAFVRLAGMLGAAGPEIVPAERLLAELGAADEIAGHNILGFDLPALAVHHGADYGQLAAKAVDTEILARQYFPPRSRESGTSEDRYDLDHVAALLGVPGKTDDLTRLKRQHGGWDKIPLDDPEYRAYLEGDLHATAAVAALLPRDAYTAREHRVAAIAGQMTLSGFRVDIPLLEERYAAGQQKKRDALEFLHDAFGLPLGKTVLRGRGKARHEEYEELDAPLAGDSGRKWLEGIWERFGVADPPRTAKAGKLSTGADDLKTVAADPRCPAELKGIIQLIGTIVGTRTVYQTARDNLCPDGRVHPKNSFRQASGRWSVTNPGLTVFGKRGGKHVERDIFLPEPGHVLISADLSQVDMRTMAWLSEDHAYRALFAPGKDAHQEIADQVGVSRQDAKAIGHGWNYGLGAKRMINNGLDPEKVYAFINGMEARFPRLIAWREQIRERGAAGEILDNGFGRRMRCDVSRAYTVAPALMGQGGARDIMAECLLRLPPAVIPMLRAFVHDEILISVPKEQALDVAGMVKKAMTWPLDSDLWVTCDMAFGSSWGEVSAK